MSGDLVPEHHRLAEPNGAETAVAIVVHVGSTYSAGDDIDKHLSRLCGRSGGFFNPQVFWAVTNYRFHIPTFHHPGLPKHCISFCPTELAVGSKRDIRGVFAIVCTLTTSSILTNVSANIYNCKLFLKESAR